MESHLAHTCSPQRLLEALSDLCSVKRHSKPRMGEDQVMVALIGGGLKVALKLAGEMVGKWN